MQAADLVEWREVAVKGSQIRASTGSHTPMLTVTCGDVTTQAVDLVEWREVAVKVHQLNPAWNDAKRESYVKHAVRVPCPCLLTCPHPEPPQTWTVTSPAPGHALDVQAHKLAIKAAAGLVDKPFGSGRSASQV